MKRKIYFLILLMLFQTGKALASPPSQQLNAQAIIRDGRYDSLKVGILSLTDQGAGALPGTCPPGSLYNQNGVLNICGPGGTYGPIASNWTQTGTNLYPATLTWNVGIGTATPLAPLEIYSTSGFTNIDIVEGTVPSRWSLRSYLSYPVFGGSLPAPFIIDNPAYAGIGNGTFIITEDGKVIIAKDTDDLPVYIPNMLNVQTDNNAIINAGVVKYIAYDNLAATFTNNVATLGNAVGIGFGVDPNSPNTIINGAIAVEKVANGGRMHFAALGNPAGGNLPIAMTITENNRVSIGDSAPSTDAHLLITRNTGDVLDAATLAIVDIDFAGDIGKIGFQRVGNFTYIAVDNSGDLYIDKNSAAHRLAITTTAASPNDHGTIRVYNSAGVADGYVMISPDTTKILRARVTVVNPTVTIDPVNSSSGFVTPPIFNGKGDYSFSFTTPFATVPVINCSSFGAATRICNIKNVSTSAFRIFLYQTDGQPADGDFNLMVIGQR